VRRINRIRKEEDMGRKKDGKKDGQKGGNAAVGGMGRILVMDIYDGGLEMYAALGDGKKWELAIAGYWSEGRYHGGWVDYYIRNPEPGTWVMKSVQRNSCLDFVTEEDVEEGRLNDDQAQALCFTTLEEAQNATFEKVVAVIVGAPPDLAPKEAARQLYQTVRSNQGLVVSEPEYGLLVE